ncbi:MAG: putative toxin-antitoxin system toxin component, PIN family [Nitrospirota bacterium]
MRVVLDTNVIVAAFATKGLCLDIFEVCLLDHSIIISGYILLEVKEKLIDKIHLPQSSANDIVSYLRNQAEVVMPEEVHESVCRDKDDINIIGTALSGNARFIITGDEDLLSLKKYKNIAILTPREFWSRLSR